MLHSTFVLSLLASAVSAQVNIGLPDLPSFMLVAPGATIDPISSRVSTVRPTPTLTPKPTPTPTPSPVDDDQPDPYNSSLQLPASESFNPSKAPAFTQLPGMPNISNGPVFSSEPCTTETTITTVTAAPPAPTSEPCTEEASKTTGTPLPISPSTIPTGGPPPPPLLSGFPTFVPPPSFTRSSSTRATPLPISPSTIPTGGPPPPPVSSGFPTFVPRPSTTLVASSRPAYQLGNAFPTYVPRPSERPAYGAGRPRPTGAWPSRARPSRAHKKPHRMSRPVKGAASTPCTLETRVRATPTGAA